MKDRILFEKVRVRVQVRSSKIEVWCGSACRSVFEVRLCVRHTVKILATQRLEIRPSLNIFALTIIFRHNWACPQGFWNICYLIGNVENCLAILPPMKCSRNSRHCKNDSSTVHKWGKLKMKENKRKYFSWWKFFSWKLGQGCGHIWTLSPCDLYKITLGLCANTCILFSKYSILSSSSIPFIGPRW